MTRRLTVAHLTAIDLPPPAFIEAAARAGFDGVGLRLLTVTPDSPGYPLMDTPTQMRATKAALAATGLRVADIEFVRITPETKPDTLAPLLDAGAELGARHLITAPYDPDLSRMADTLAAIDTLARARGLGTVLEFFPWTVVPTLRAAIDVVTAAGPAVGVLVDALHFDRSGSTLHDLVALPPHRLPFAHICDAPVHPPYSEQDLIHTARQDRLPPGHGAIDLRAWLQALPPDLPLCAEVPMTARRTALGAEALLSMIHDACRTLLSQ